MAGEREKRIRSEEEVKKKKDLSNISGTETLILPFSSFLWLKGQFLENDNEIFNRLACLSTLAALSAYSSLTLPILQILAPRPYLYFCF